MSFFPVANPLFWHQIFETLAILLGVQFYRYLGRQQSSDLFSRAQFPIVVGALLGAGIGNKAVFWLERADLWATLYADPTAWFMGQSMVGGLLGGLLGVEFAKRLTGQRQSTGDRFVYPLLLALCIGRIGCFVAGLSDGTSGNPTPLPWGVDFGDGVFRHPTQLYEIVFVLLLWALLYRFRQGLCAVPGLQFRVMLSAYLLWRLLIDGIKPVPYDWVMGLSGIQLVCLVALLLYVPGLWRSGFIQGPLNVNVE